MFDEAPTFGALFKSHLGSLKHHKPFGDPGTGLQSELVTIPVEHKGRRVLVFSFGSNLADMTSCKTMEGKSMHLYGKQVHPNNSQETTHTKQNLPY